METVNEKVSQAIMNNAQSLAEKIVARQYELQPEIWEQYGEKGRKLAVRDAKYHLDYLVEAIAASSPALFTDYIAWVKVLFAGIDLPPESLDATLKCTREVLNQELPTELREVARQYVEVALGELPRLPSELPSVIGTDNQLADLAQQYLDALLKGERHIANRLILDAVEAGTSVKDIYLNVFQRSQHEIGRLWQMNKISVAQEHYCTAATQLIMAQLYPHIFAMDRIDRKLVATSVSEELHELGIRMVADFFEMEGWDTFYLGANTPTRSILETIAARRANVLAISVTIAAHIKTAADLIAAVRTTDRCRDINILVGGYAFNTAPDLWRKLGADGYARDAQEAIAVANGMMSDA